MVKLTVFQKNPLGTGGFNLYSGCFLKGFLTDEA